VTLGPLDVERELTERLRRIEGKIAYYRDQAAG
jgi:hypothetical protein